MGSRDGASGQAAQRRKNFKDNFNSPQRCLLGEGGGAHTLLGGRDLISVRMRPVRVTGGHVLFYFYFVCAC